MANAGIARDILIGASEPADFDAVLSVNLSGVVHCCREAARRMIGRRRGSIVNLSSVAGLVGNPYSIGYAASKWAVRGMTKVAAKELGRYGIRVNSIHPGFIQTDMIAHFPEMHDDDKRARTERATPLQRLGVPDDVANVVLFLAGDGSAYCTGQEFVVDGGVQC